MFHVEHTFLEKGFGSTLKPEVRQIQNDFCKPTFIPKNERTNSTLLKVSFFVMCSKMKLIPFKNFTINTCFIQFI